MKKILKYLRSFLVNNINKLFGDHIRTIIIRDFLDTFEENYIISCYIGKDYRLPYYASLEENYTESDFDLFMDVQGDDLKTIGEFHSTKADATNVFIEMNKILKSMI